MPEVWHGCIICNRRAKWRFSPDLDIWGIGSCEKHLEVVRVAYTLLISSGKEAFEEYVKHYQEGIKKQQNAIKGPGNNSTKRIKGN